MLEITSNSTEPLAHNADDDVLSCKSMDSRDTYYSVNEKYEILNANSLVCF